MKKKTNIILIGMPGVGKSTVGVILAKMLGCRFIDTDLLIQEKEGKLLKDIIREKGASVFLEIENTVNASVYAHHAVIATGGSVVYGKEAMRHLKEIGTVVYLKVSFAGISCRLRNMKGRGVVLKDGQTLRTLYEERIRLYERYADVKIVTDHLNVEQTVRKVLYALKRTGFPVPGAAVMPKEAYNPQAAYRLKESYRFKVPDSPRETFHTKETYKPGKASNAKEASGAKEASNAKKVYNAKETYKPGDAHPKNIYRKKGKHKKCRKR